MDENSSSEMVERQGEDVQADKARLWLSSLTFSDGTTIGINPDDIIVMVGPNNSGKSAALKEIEDRFRHQPPSPNVVVKSKLEKQGDLEAVNALFEEHSHKTYPNGSLHYSGSGYHVQASRIEHGWETRLDIVREFFCRRLKTESRILDSNGVPSFRVLTEAASRPIQMMYADGDVEQRLSKYFEEAFDQDLIVLKAGGSEIPLLVGKNIALEDGEDRTTKSYLVRLMKNAAPLTDQGDGMRSFASVILEMLANQAPSVLLLDEPEAFLHPPQARLLGEFLARERRTDAQMFIATHSPDVLIGLLNEAPEQLRIVRIERQGDVNKVKELEKSKAREIAADPLMKYSSVLSGVFHKRVIICESDADCLFYQAILAEPSVKEGPHPDVLFLHASGKHRMAAMAEALRALGVRVDVIADIDLLREKGTLKKLMGVMGGDWNRISGPWEAVRNGIESRKPWLNAQAVQTEISNVFSDLDLTKELPESCVSEIKSTLKKASPWEAVKIAGVSAVPPGQATMSMNLLQAQLEGVGIWIVPQGELEGFCRSIGGHGPKWVQTVLETKDLSGDEFSAARDFVRGIWSSSR